MKIIHKIFLFVKEIDYIYYTIKNLKMKTYYFIIQTTWLSDVDYTTEAKSLDEAVINLRKDWPEPHKYFIQ